MADHQSSRLDEIEQRIAATRIAYLKAVWAGHDGEAEVDRLLGVWDDVRTGQEGASLTRPTSPPATIPQPYEPLLLRLPLRS